MLKVLLFTFHRQLVLSSMRQRLKKLKKKEQGRVFRPQKLIHYSYVLGSFLKFFFFKSKSSSGLSCDCESSLHYSEEELSARAGGADGPL